MSDFNTKLGKLLQAENINVEEEQLNKLEVFYEMIIEKNKVMNLTAITDEDEFIIKHIYDSIIMMNYYNLNELEENDKILDLGTGAGFPGVPLAIMNPKLHFVLVDSLQKRLDFIDDVCKEININNVTTIHSRFEDLGRDEDYREKCKLVVSRAVAPLNILMEYAIPFIVPNYNFIAYKSKETEKETMEAENAFDKLKCAIKDRFDYKLPNINEDRTILVINKKEATDNKYPRKAGKLQKKPL
ncbi:MAG: 16S rRNA (guanine(527)-N(7))-methyltransferase RsmG [Lachnospiraceae bacterium]|nr:16S rRNA (guanine(527)-N(7))-methyltransferase RsmG [Lachnospiraceae bacterium]